MPLTQLDPRTALVTIDLQKALLALPTLRPAAEVARAAGELAAAFRRRRLPVILVRTAFAPDFSDRLQTRVEAIGPRLVPGPDYAEPIDELGAAFGDIHITKRQWGAFYGTDLDLQLRRRGVTGIVLGGISTSIGVESTARAAWEHGYQVTFAVDAMSDTDAAAQQHSLTRIFPRLGEQDGNAAILAALG